MKKVGSELGTHARRAVRWTTVNAFGGLVLHVLQILVLARLLSPADFGQMAMVMAITAIAATFAELGLSSAIIQRTVVRSFELATLYVVNILAGAVLFVLFWIGAPWISRMVEVGEIADMIRFASIAFLVTPFGLQFRALLQKALDFKWLTMATLSGQAIGALTAIILAIKGFGVWSLLVGYVSTEAIVAAVLVSIGIQRGFWSGFGWKLAAVRSYLVFGGYRLAAMIANAINSRVDQLTIGTLVGSSPLGYYNVAHRLAMDPVQRVNPIVTRVAFPAFSIAQDEPARLLRGYLRMNELLLGINAPLLLGLAATAHVAVPLLLGPNWNEAIFLVQALALYALFRSVGNAGGALIMAKGRADWSFYWNVSLLALVPSVIILVAVFTQSVAAIAVSLAVMQGVLLVVHYFALVRRLIGPCGRAYFSSLARPFLTASVMAIAVNQIDVWLTAYTYAPRLAILTMFGVLLYFLLSLLFQRRLLQEMYRLITV